MSVGGRLVLIGCFRERGPGVYGVMRVGEGEGGGLSESRSWD